MKKTKFYILPAGRAGARFCCFAFRLLRKDRRTGGADGEPVQTTAVSEREGKGYRLRETEGNGKLLSHV